MNIAFWSNVAGRGATSGNMLAVGAMTSLLYGYNTVMVQTDIMSKPIDEVFEGKRTGVFVNEEFQFYNRRGMDEIIERGRMKLLTKETVETNLLNVKQTTIRYMPSARGNGVDDSGNLSDIYKILMEKLNEVGEINFWDLRNGPCLSSKTILEKSDVAVINLSQDGQNSYIPEDEKFLEKAVFIIGRYDDRSRKSIGQICREYGINSRNAGVIPYNIRFHDAINDGRVVPFLMKNIFSKKQDVNFDFVNQLFHATNLILKKAGVKGIEE